MEECAISAITDKLVEGVSIIEHFFLIINVKESMVLVTVTMERSMEY